MKKALLLVALVALLAAALAPVSASALSTTAPSVNFTVLNWKVCTGYHTVYYQPNDHSPSYWVVSRQDAKIVVNTLTSLTLTGVLAQLESGGKIVSSKSDNTSHVVKSLPDNNIVTYTHTPIYVNINTLKGSTRSTMTFFFSYLQILPPCSGNGHMDVRTSAF